MKIKYKCKVCDGSGTRANPDFEACRSKTFRDDTGLEKEGDCDHCANPNCGFGEFETCYNCDGEGFMEVDTTLWERVKLLCLRCGWRWHPRGDEEPMTCPNKKCKSPYYNTPRTRPKKNA